jgi:hypothetical protein
MGQREIASLLRVGLGTVQLWIARAATGAPLTDRPSGAAWNRSDSETELLVVQTRDLLKVSPLGEIGAEAIHRQLLAQDIHGLPSTRTIGRILARSGVLDGKRRIRRPAPPAGWYLPDLAARQVELDSFDAVAGLVIRGGPEIEVLNGVSLHGGLVASWPEESVTTDFILPRLLEHWILFGLPAYAQFDNDTRFQGAHQFKDSLGRVVRQCLSLGVTPVFAPPREPGFQNSIESFNGRWQSKVWNRWEHPDLDGLQARSEAYITACRARLVLRIQAAPARADFPQTWVPKKRPPLIGKVIFIRRSDDKGRVTLLGRVFETNPDRANRLVRAEVLYDQQRIDFYALRRAQPQHQPLISQATYKPRID